MIIIALDLASVTGWCVGAPGQRTPDCGSVRFATKGASHNAIAGKAQTWLEDIIDRHKPNAVVLEQEIHKQKWRSSQASDAITQGLIFLTRAVAYRKGIYKIDTYPVNSIRKFFIGSSPPRILAKRQTVSTCRALGWIDDFDDDAADACALWLFACSKFAPHVGLRVSPLFKSTAVA